MRLSTMGMAISWSFLISLKSFSATIPVLGNLLVKASLISNSLMPTAAIVPSNDVSFLEDNEPQKTLLTEVSVRDGYKNLSGFQFPLANQTSTLVAHHTGNRVASEYGYGDGFHGRCTAGGQVFNTWSNMAAHKSLKLGTVVKLVNTKNGRSTTIWVVDRGPYVSGKHYDISRHSMNQLGVGFPGTAWVTAQVVGYKPLPARVCGF